MPKLTANTLVMHDGEHVLLVEGGELPDWAVGLVGDHLLDSPAKREAEPEKGDEPSKPGEPKEPEAPKGRPAAKPSTSK